MEEHYRTVYNFLKDTDQLDTVSRKLKGIWKEDKDLFINLQEKLMEDILKTPIHLDLDEDVE